MQKHGCRRERSIGHHDHVTNNYVETLFSSYSLTRNNCLLMGIDRVIAGRYGKRILTR